MRFTPGTTRSAARLLSLLPDIDSDEGQYSLRHHEQCLERAGQTTRAKLLRDYAVPSDVCKLFHDHMNHLYTLSVLLTADHHAAEQCFIAGLEDCLEGAFREWAPPWAKRSIIKNAIRMISPSRNNTVTPTESRELAEPISNACALRSAIQNLPPFERFVYVISVLEKYADRECSILLDCTVAEIVHARTRALQQLATSLSRSGQLCKGCLSIKNEHADAEDRHS